MLEASQGLKKCGVSCRRFLLQRLTSHVAGLTPATIFRQIGEEAIHDGVFGRVDQRPAFAAEGDEASMLELT